MDFKLFLGVLKRYKRIVIGGTVLAVMLSVLSYGTPGLKGGKPTIIPRGSETWQGTAELLISQAGFPYDRAVQQVIPGKGISIPPETVGDLTYMSNLSSVYAAMANGTYVQRRVATETHVPLCPLTVSATAPTPTATATANCATVVAATVAQSDTGAPLPLITLTSSAPTAREAVKLAATTLSVLRNKITQEQATAGTPVDQRVELDTVMTGAPATLTQGYKKTVPILVLFAVISASIALAFILNNHSDDPVRSTRRRLDDALDPNGGLAFAGAGNGHFTEPNDGLVQTSGGMIKLNGVRRASFGTRLAGENNAAAQPDVTLPHFPRAPGFEAESRD